MSARLEEDSAPCGDERAPYGFVLARRVAKALMSTGHLHGSERKDLVVGDSGIGIRFTDRKMFEIPMSEDMRRDWNIQVTNGSPVDSPPLVGCCMKPQAVEAVDEEPRVVVESAPCASWKGQKLPCVEVGADFVDGQELFERVAELNQELNAQNKRVAFPSDEGGFVLAACANGLAAGATIMRWETEDQFVAWLGMQSDYKMSGKDLEADIVTHNETGVKIDPNGQLITRSALEEYVSEREHAQKESASQEPKCGSCCLQ